MYNELLGEIEQRIYELKAYKEAIDTIGRWLKTCVDDDGTFDPGDASLIAGYQIAMAKIAKLIK